MSPQALFAVGSPLSVSWFLPAEVSGIDLWSSSLEVGNPLHQLMVSQSYSAFCREHQASSSVHTMCILYSCKCQYHPIPTSVVSASKCTRASIVPLGIFWFALALPIKQIHWKDHIQWVYLVLEPTFWQLDKKGVYRSSSGAPRYPINLWYLWLIIVFLILPMNMSEDPPICKVKYSYVFSKWTKSGTSNSWTRLCSCFTSYWRRQLVSCVTVVKWVNENCTGGWFYNEWYEFVQICRKNKIGPGYVCFIIGVTGGCPETSGTK